MGCNMTEDIEKRIDRCVEKYQNLVKEINDLEFEHNIYEGRMENYKDLLIKEDLTPSEFKLLTIYKSLKVDNDIVLRMLANKKEILESKKPYFEIGASDVLNELQKMTGGEIIARKLDKLGAEKGGYQGADIQRRNGSCHEPYIEFRLSPCGCIRRKACL